MLFIMTVDVAARNPGEVLGIDDFVGPLLRRIAGMAEAQDSLTDGELQSEIELVGDLVVAATSSDGPLPQEEIDRLLGVQAGQEGKASEEPAPETDI